MSEENGLIKVDTQAAKREEFLNRAVSPETMAAVEEAHATFFGALADTALSVPQRTVMTAAAITALTKALDGPILKEVIMPLMNSPVGFDTDRNPAKAWGGKSIQPYGETTVLGCAVEAWLRGLPMVGNAWNIIADRMYPRKEGFELLLMDHCRFTATADVPPLPPEIYAAGGYLTVPVKIQYRLHTDGEDDPNRRFTGTYKVRANKKNAVAVEASEGKAKRKAYRDLLAEITGMLLPDGEVDEAAVFQVGSHHGEPSPPRGTGVDRAADAIPQASANVGLMSNQLRGELEEKAKARGKYEEVCLAFGPAETWKVHQEPEIQEILMGARRGRKEER